MPAMIGYYDTLKSVAGKVFTFLASITLTGTDGKTLTVEDTSLVNQDLTTDASPTFTTAKLTGLTDGYLPKHTSDAVGLADSPLYTDGTNVGIGAVPGAKFDVRDGSFHLTDADVAHGITDWLPTNAYSGLRPYDNAAGSGGLDLVSISDADAEAIRIVGLIGSTDPTDTKAAIRLKGGKKGTGVLGAALGATETVLVVDNFYTDLVTILGSGYFGIGMVPTVQFELSGSVGQKASGTTWSNPSDIRLKENITLADLDRCYEIIKGIPLKRYTLKTEAFSVEQAKDRSKLGWIADDVEPYFAKSVPTATFSLVKVPDGEEEYEEQDFVMKTVEKEEVSIETREGQPIPVKKVIRSEEKVLLFDDVQVEDELGNEIFQTDKEGIEHPVMYRIPRMIKKIRPKFRQDTIEECKSLDADQLFAAMYGALQALMAKVETLERE